MKIFAIILLSCSLTYAQNSYYISNTGDGSNDGHSASTPITLSIFKGIVLNKKDTAYFNRGEVFSLSNYTINKDSVTFSAYGSGSNPEFTGAININGSWSNQGNGIYSIQIPNFKWLYLNEVASHLAESNWYKIIRHSPATSPIIRGDTSILNHVSSIIGAKVRVFEAAWTLSLEYSVLAYSKLTGDITLNRACQLSSINNPFIIYNQFQWIKTNDDFYYDGRILFYKSSSEPGNLNLKASIKDTCLIVNAAEVKIRNITFSKFAKFGIYNGYTSSSPNLTIDSCVFNDVKGYAILSVGKGTNLSVTNCSFNRIGISAIRVQKAPHTNVNYNILNSIGMDKNYPLTFSIPIASGTLYYNTQAIGIGNSDSSKILYNTITNVNYCGITLGSSYSEIAYNKVNRFMQRLDDGGAVYNIGTTANPSTGNKIHHNFIFDNLTTFSAITQNNLKGIYRDNFGTNDSIHSNTIYNILGTGVFIGYDNYHHITHNNTIFNCTISGISFTEIPASSPVYGSNVGHVVTHNKIFSKDQIQNGIGLIRVNPIAGYNPFINGGLSDYNTVISPYHPNLFGWYKTPSVRYTLAAWRSYTGTDSHSTYLNNFHGYVNDATASTQCFIATNPTNASTIFTLGGTFYNDVGLPITSIILQPWSSALYYK